MTDVKMCRQCPKASPIGWVTCGNSFCQQKESEANKERAGLVKRKRK